MIDLLFFRVLIVLDAAFCFFALLSLSGGPWTYWAIGAPEFFPEGLPYFVSPVYRCHKLLVSRAS